MQSCIKQFPTKLQHLLSTIDAFPEEERKQIAEEINEKYDKLTDEEKKKYYRRISVCHMPYIDGEPFRDFVTKEIPMTSLSLSKCLNYSSIGKYLCDPFNVLNTQEASIKVILLKDYINAKYSWFVANQ